MKNFYWYENKITATANTKEELREFLSSISSTNRNGMVQKVDLNNIIPVPSEEMDPCQNYTELVFRWREKHWGTKYNPSDITISDINKNDNKYNVIINFVTYKNRISDNIIHKIVTNNPNITFEYIGDSGLGYVDSFSTKNTASFSINNTGNIIITK